MSAKLLLRAASAVMLLLAIGHTLGNPWTPAQGPDALAVVAAMRDYHFNVMGLERSYFNFYVGFGWMLSAYLFGHAILYWQLASILDRVGYKLGGIVGVLAIESLCMAILSWKFLFWVPVIMSALIALLLAASFYRIYQARGIPGEPTLRS
jgi:MFS family permease